MKQGVEWVSAGGPEDQLDRERGLRRAHAATLLLLGLPGSTYLYPVSYTHLTLPTKA